MSRLAALLLAFAPPMTAAAAATPERLRVDVLVFINPPTADERGSAPRHPDDARAVSIDDLRGLAYAGIAPLPETASTLTAEWALLGASKSYRPLLRLSWLQAMPPAENGPALRLYLPAGNGSSVGGWLRLHGGNKLQLSTDLESVQPGADGAAQGLRLKARRSLAVGSLHYLDSPGVGLLVRLTPAR